MEKLMQETFDNLNFALKSCKLEELIGDEGKYGKYNTEQFLTVYNIYNKADNGYYSLKAAEVLHSLYDVELDLLIDITKNPKDEVPRKQFLAIEYIFNIYGIRTNIGLNAIARRNLKRGSKTLPSEEKLFELVKKIFPQEKAQ